MRHKTHSGGSAGLLAAPGGGGGWGEFGLMSNDGQFWSWKVLHTYEKLLEVFHVSISWQQAGTTLVWGIFCWMRQPACICIMIFTKVHHILLNMLFVFFFRNFPKSTRRICNELEIPRVKEHSVSGLPAGGGHWLPPSTGHMIQYQLVSEFFGWRSTAVQTHKVLSFSWWTDSRMGKSIHQPEQRRTQTHPDIERASRTARQK